MSFQINLSRFDECEWKGKRVLITGGAGFIGSWLADALVRLGADVTVFDSLFSGKLQNLRSILKSIKFVRGDIRNLEKLKQVVKGKTIVFHLAATANVPYSVKKPRHDFEVNARGTFNLLRAVQSLAKKARVVYTSTAAVYGSPIYTPIDEFHPLKPISPYGASKLAGEAYCSAFQETYGLEILTLRLFNIYGPRQPRYVMYDLLKRLSEDNNGKLKVLGTGNQVRDFTYITDAVMGFLLASQNDNVIGHQINIGSGQATSIKELALLILEIQGLNDITLEFTGTSWKGDVEKFLADNSKAKKLLGFRTTVSLVEGLKQEIRWFKKNWHR